MVRLLKEKVFGLILVMVQCVSMKMEECPNVRTDFRALRKRRHITFPDGSAATITISGAKAFLTHVPSGWMMTTDLDVAYPLPNAKFTNAHFRRKLHHRQKREFWERVKNAFYLHNYNGHDCLLRSICEAKVHLAPPGRSLVHDILRAIFTGHAEGGGLKGRLQDTNSQVTTSLIQIHQFALNPHGGLYPRPYLSERRLCPNSGNGVPFEEEFIDDAGGMYEEILDPAFCDKVPDCPFSLIQFILVFNKKK